MSDDGPVVGLVCCAAGGVEDVRVRFVEPAVDRGWRVAVTLTPTAATWLAATGEVDRLAGLTGLPVRSARRLPGEERPHPAADCWVVAPATANSVASLALGLTPYQALTQLCEAVGAQLVPVIVFPRVNAGHAGHPSWNDHLNVLRKANVRLIYGPDTWPLYPPREGPPDREPPWARILDATAEAVSPDARPE